MTSIELAEKIYNHINSLNSFGERWDKWDDKREIEFIRSLIDNHHQSKVTLYTEEQVKLAITLAKDSDYNSTKEIIQSLK